jgi:predicted nucleotidyltransferase
MDPYPGKLLFIAEVGSRMWGMEEFASDYDWVHIYQVTTRSILEGRKIPGTCPQKQYIDEPGRLIDASYMEIGHLVQLLISGNINAIWAATSPLVISDPAGARERLRKVVVSTLSRQSYHSIRGMAESQASDAFRKRGRDNPEKPYLTAIRTLRFGQRLLGEGILDYRVMDGLSRDPEGIPKDHYAAELLRLDEVCRESRLPPYPDDRPFRDLLFAFRTEDLECSRRS